MYTQRSNTNAQIGDSSDDSDDDMDSDGGWSVVSDACTENDFGNRAVDEESGDED
jgi:hypothetical protein